MDELSKYPEGKAQELAPDCIVFVKSGDYFVEKTVDKLATGDLYKLQACRKFKDVRVKDGLEFCLMNEVSILNEEMPSGRMISFVQNGKVIAYYLLDEDFVFTDFRSMTQYVMDKLTEDEL